MQKLMLWIVVVGTLRTAFSSSAEPPPRSEDEAAIRANVAAYVEASNRKDSKALAALWLPEGVYISRTTGQQATGAVEIERELAAEFEGGNESKLEVSIDSVDLLSPNVAVECGTARIIVPEEAPEELAYTAVHVKRDGKWLLDRVTEEVAFPPPPPSNYEHLKELEWMIGTWIDQDENATVQIECEWTKNQNFMNRSFAVVVGDEVDMAGMQIIGWDPVAKQIRSWVFDSDGGFGEGKWIRKGERWQIHQTGILPNGSKSSAVNIMTPVDDDSFTWQSVSREIDGDVLPNVDEVLVVRKPAEASAPVNQQDSSAAKPLSNTEVSK